MTSLPEWTPKKTTVPPIVALLSNGCKQAFPLFTVDLQRARHNILGIELIGHMTIIPQQHLRILSLVYNSKNQHWSLKI
jgi:hypothetical protein